MRKLNFNILVCGNASLTGEYNFSFNTSIPKETQFELVAEALQVAKKQLEAQGIVSAPGHNGNREVLAPAPPKE